MRSLLRLLAAVMVLVLAAALITGCGNHKSTRITEVKTDPEGVPVGPAQPVIVGDEPPPAQPKPDPGQPVLVPDEGDIIVPK
jgi:hypothetical protein